MEWLAENGCRVIPLSEAIRAVRGGRDLPWNTVVLSFDDGYQDNLTFAAPIVRQYGYAPVVFVCPAFFGRPAGRNGYFVAPSRFLTSAEAAELIREGWEIGGHTLTHPDLTAAAPGDKVEAEVSGCRVSIREVLGYDTRVFAYPFGRFSEAVKGWVRRCGFETACSTLHGFNVAATDPLELRRIPVHAAADLVEFQKKVRGAYDWLTYFERRALRQQS
jgi:peptidoglycan/xylan/chitin deacetylase (PgdA/CDA1 family)